MPVTEYIERDFKEAYKQMKERALDAEHCRDALVKALQPFALNVEAVSLSKATWAYFARASISGERCPRSCGRSAEAMNDHREAMREMGPQADPVREALRRMIAEFGDEHYHTCPADNDSGPCDCFAGHLLNDARRAIEAVSVSSTNSNPTDNIEGGA